MKKQGLLLAAVLFCRAAFADDSFFDNYVYQNWNSFGTLNGTSTTDVFQTKDGYINIGTYEGLARFDGITFTTHKRAKGNGLTFVSVRAILEDSQGNLWLGSNDEGLQKISKDGKKTFTTQNGLPNNSIRALAEDRKGNVWVGTAAGVVYITPKGHMINVQFEAGTISKGIIATSFFCDAAGDMWLLTANERGLFHYDGDIFRTRRELDNYGNYLASAICQDKDGAYWVGLGDMGLLKIRGGTIEEVKSGTILDRVAMTAPFVAADGTIWFGTEKGLVVYSGGTFHEYKGSQLNSAKINKIICDREGSIWAATDRNGIGKLTLGKFRIIKLPSAVNSITEDRRGTVWAGTDTGVRCYKDDQEIKNTITAYTEGLRIRDVQATKDGSLLVCCYTAPALLRCKDGHIQSWSKESGLAGNKVRVAIETRNGDIYAGTTTGLSIIHSDGSIRNFKQAEGLENEYIMALYQDTNGTVWIGTDGGGIYLMKDEKIIAHLSSENGLAGNVIFKITQELDGSVWICSGSGITRCPTVDPATGIPASYQNINSENGIETDSVFQLAPDSMNNLWMTSNHGISSAPFMDMLDLADGKRDSISVKFYSRNDGLDSAGPTSTAKSMTDRHGRVWFAMVDGIAVYDPEKNQENMVMPLVRIESVTVDNEMLIDHKLFAGPEDEIVLRPGTKRVDIQFSGISFDAPERIRFTHKLTNFEDEFSEPDNARIMSYTNLRPGRHTFLVNAINGDGFYSTQAETVLFVQKPYIYQVPAFWITLAALLFGGIYIFFHLRERRMKRENLRLENMVQLRTSQLNTEKEKSDQLLRAILPEEIADELKDGVHSIGQDFDDVTILFSDIVGFTSTSSGHTAAEIVGALNDLFSLFDVRAQKYGVEKIKTIGDAYMATCGLPTPNSRHAEVMVAFAKGMLEDIAQYNKTASIPFNIRIGLNCGPVTAGVIGKTKFIYDVWGNTVNVASRMETAANPGGIRVSETVYQHLKDSGLTFSAPIECNIKGKGLMTTYDIL